MADEQRKITILDFQIKDSDLLQRIGEVKKEVKALREANKELGKSFGENAVEIAKNEIVIAELGKEERNLKNITAQSVTANKARTGSIQQMRAEYSNLKKQYDQLSKSERESTQAGKDMAKQLETLANEMNAANKNAGSFKDNIGRYPAVFKDAVKSVNVFGVNIGQAGETLKSGAKGFGEFTKGITSTKGALTALVAVPVILVLTAIVAVLAKLGSATDFIGDKFGQFTAGLGGGFDFLVGKVGELLENFDFSETLDKVASDFKAFFRIQGEAVALFFQGKPSAAIAKFGELGETNLGRFAKGLSNAFTVAGDLERRLQDLADAEVANSVAVAQSDAATSKALIQIKNRNISLKEKIEILDAASALETATAKESLSIAAQEEAVQIIRMRSLVSQDAERDKLAEAQKKRIGAQEKADNVQEKIAARRSALIETELAQQLAASEKAYNIEKTNAERAAQLAKDELKLFDIAAKDELRTAKKNGEDLEVLRRLQGQRRIELQRKIADGIAAAEKELADKLAGFREAEAKFDADRQQQRIDQANKLLDIALTESDRRFAELETKRAEQVAAGELSAEDAANASRGQRQLQLETELELERINSDAVLANDALSAKNRETLLKESGDRQTKLRLQVAKTEIEIAKETADKQAKIEKEKFDTTKNLVSGIGSLFDILASDQEEAVQLQKVTALAQIAIDTAQAISALVRASSQNPLNPPTSGLAGAVQFTAGIAQILANIAQAKNLLSSFEHGGLIDTARNSGITLKGRRHRDGGTRIFIEGTGWVEAERGEVLTIVKRTDSAKLGRLSAENQRRGGGAFYETGAAMTLNAAAALSGTASIDYARLALAVSALPAPASIDYAALTAAMAAQPAPVVKVTDINRVQGNVARVTQNGKI